MELWGWCRLRVDDIFCWKIEMTHNLAISRAHAEMNIGPVWIRRWNRFRYFRKKDSFDVG